MAKYLEDRKYALRVHLILFALGALSVAPFFFTYQSASINDEGVVSLGALRLWLGQSIYTDFTTHFAPGTYYLTLLNFWIFGPTVFAVRFTMAIIAGGLGLTIFLLARRCLPPRWAIVPYLLFLSAGVTQWPILSYHWCGILSFLLGTLALIRFTERPDDSSAALCGAGAGLAVWVLQSEAAALLLLTCVVAVLSRSFFRPRHLAFWLVGAIGTSSILWLPVLWSAPFSEIWLQNVDWAINHNAVPGGSPFDLSNITIRWDAFFEQVGSVPWSFQGVNWTVNSVAYLLVWSFNYALFYPVLILAVLLSLRKHERGGLQVLVWSQIALVLVWKSRQTLLYLNYLTPIMFILAAVLLHRLGRRGVPIAVFLCSIYATSYVYMFVDSGRYIFPIQTPRGTLYSSDPSEAQSLNHLYRVAAQWTPAGTRAYCYPYAMGFFFLSGVEPTGRLPLVIPILGPDDEVPGLARQLHDQKVEFIYYFPWSANALEAVPLVDRNRFDSLMESFNKMILEGYEPVVDLTEGAHLYQRTAHP